MNSQKGSSLVVSLILLTIITLVAVYSIEGSNIQTKMVANSLFSTLTYQECRNEQEANVRFFNANGGTQRNTLLDLRSADTQSMSLTSITKARTSLTPKSDSIDVSWNYLQEAPAGREGYTITIDAQSRAYLYENNCIANYSFSTNDQTLGAIVEGLQQAGNIN